MANIKKITKKNGTIVYRTNIYLGIDKATGKQARTTITATTKKAIKIKTREAINEFAHNGYTVKKKVNVKTYRELVSLWWDSYKNTVKPNTKKAVKSYLDAHLLPAFGEYRLDNLTTPVIQKQVNKWANKANRQSKNAFDSYHKLVGLNKRILKYGVSLQLLEHNPATDVIVPRKKQEKKTEIKFLDKQELKQFLNYLDTLDQAKYKNLFNIVLYKTLLATGLRIGEAMALEWSDIDLDNGVIDVNKTLNNRIEINSPKSMASYRQISIDKATILMLKQYKNRQQVKAWELGRSEKIVFSNFTGKYFDPNNIRNQLYKHFKNAGVPNVRFHGLRHTHATLMLNAGMSPKDLQHRLGHSNITMTLNIYVHATEEGAKQGGNIFEMAINNL